MNPLSRCLLLLALLAQGPAIAQTTRDTVITTVVAAADEQPAPWRYTTSPPSSDWFKPDFNALSWLHGNGGFGSAGTPGAIISTTWETPGIWLRRHFDLPDPLPADLHLWMIHDEDAEIYLNGVPALRVSGWTTDYQVFPMDKSAILNSTARQKPE
jgi:hypothetical protein